jgi:hypothetical protein
MNWQIQITYKNQGGGDSGPLSISVAWLDQSSFGGKQRGPLGAGQTATVGGDPNDQAGWIGCQLGRLNVSIAQNSGAPVPEINTANNSASFLVSGDCAAGTEKIVPVAS